MGEWTAEGARERLDAALKDRDEAWKLKSQLMGGHPPERYAAELRWERWCRLFAGAELHQALTALAQERAARAVEREALAFYAYSRNYVAQAGGAEVWQDHGAKARAALATEAGGAVS